MSGALDHCADLRGERAPEGSSFRLRGARKCSDQALPAVVQHAYACDVSSWRVDQPVDSLGCGSAAANQLAPPAGGPLPLRLSRRRTRECRGRPRGRYDAGHRPWRPRDRPAEMSPSKQSPRSSRPARAVKRGLVGVQLAISEAHAGLEAAITRALGAPDSCGIAPRRLGRAGARRQPHPGGHRRRMVAGDARPRVSPLHAIAAVRPGGRDGEQQQGRQGVWHGCRPSAGDVSSSA